MNTYVILHVGGEWDVKVYKAGDLIPTSVRFASTLIVRDDGTILKNRNGSITPMDHYE